MMIPDTPDERRLRIAIYIMAGVIGCLLNFAMWADTLWGLGS